MGRPKKEMPTSSTERMRQWRLVQGNKETENLRQREGRKIKAGLLSDEERARKRS